MRICHGATPIRSRRLRREGTGQEQGSRGSGHAQAAGWRFHRWTSGTAPLTRNATLANRSEREQSGPPGRSTSGAARGPGSLPRRRPQMSQDLRDRLPPRPGSRAAGRVTVAVTAGDPLAQLMSAARKGRLRETNGAANNARHCIPSPCGGQLSTETRMKTRISTCRTSVQSGAGVLFLVMAAASAAATTAPRTQVAVHPHACVVGQRTFGDLDALVAAVPARGAGPVAVTACGSASIPAWLATVQRLSDFRLEARCRGRIGRGLRDSSRSVCVSARVRVAHSPASIRWRSSATGGRCSRRRSAGLSVRNVARGTAPDRPSSGR